jgi:hypothetical protein
MAGWRVALATSKLQSCIYAANGRISLQDRRSLRTQSQRWHRPATSCSHLFETCKADQKPIRHMQYDRANEAKGEGPD